MIYYEINFNNKIYKYLDAKPRGINELAYYLTNGQLSYPMKIFLDDEFIGLVYVEDDEGEISYQFHMTILKEDLLNS